MEDSDGYSKLIVILTREEREMLQWLAQRADDLEATVLRSALRWYYQEMREEQRASHGR